MWSLSSPLHSQCITSFLLNSSFEDQNCCPTEQNELGCAIHWEDTVSADYYHSCGYFGIPITFAPPSGIPDGNGLAGFGRVGSFGEHLQNCSPGAMQASESYRFSCYLGVNTNLSGIAPTSPTYLVLFGKDEPCVTMQSNSICPTNYGYDSLATLEFIWDSSGWYHEISPCFVAAQDYSSFIIGGQCNISDIFYVFVDLVEVLPCVDILEVDVLVVPSCSGDSVGMIDLTVQNGTPPYIYDWALDGVGDWDDDEDQDNLPPGTYAVSVTDFNGNVRCLNIAVTEVAMVGTEFTGLPTLICQYDDEIMLPAQSNNIPPITGMWTADTIYTDSFGVFTYTFEPDQCATTYTHTVRVRRQSVDTMHITYQGCIGDGYSINVNTITYDESNNYGFQTIQTPAVCDSVVIVDLTFTPPIHDTFTFSDCIENNFSIVINSTLYDEDNPTGSEIFAAANNCDSILFVELNFLDNPNGNFTQLSCEGSGYSVSINGTLYNELNPVGMEVLTGANGCDSVVQVDLIFQPISVEEISADLCSDSTFSFTVNNVIYDIHNPVGTEIMTDVWGCDSIVHIDLNFQQQIEESIGYLGCVGDGFEVVVNGVTYDQSNPVGSETMLSIQGCDSIVHINLTFNNELRDTVNYTGCEGDGYSVVINNVTYDEQNPLGQESLLSMAGCDSIVQINLQFLPDVETFINYEGCVDDGYSVSVNGVIYSESNPTGVETTTSSSGCDSIVTVRLEFLNEIEEEVIYDGCVGDGHSVIVNNVVYDELNPTGMETLQSISGCDSIVMVELAFFPAVEENINYFGCEGDGHAVVVNAMRYDEANPTGMEVMRSSEGCDSIVFVDLTYYESFEDTLNYSGCVNDGFSVRVNSVVYNEVNPTGREVMSSQQLCDSIVVIDLVFTDRIESEIVYTGCRGDGYAVIVNAVEFNELNPIGLETMISHLGCDSVVRVELIFNDFIEEQIEYSGCSGDNFSVIVNGMMYDEDNPSGLDTLTSTAGCDSIVVVNLQFANNTEEIIQYVGCTGDDYSISVNNIEYNESNPIGTEVMTSVSGCDSIVFIELEFMKIVDLDIEYQGCSGDGYEIEFNGNIYNESNPNGVETIESLNGCDTFVMIDLHFNAVEEIQLLAIILTEANRNIDITTYVNDRVGDPQAVYWIPADSVSCEDCIRTEFLGETDQVLNAIIVDSMGCDIKFSIPIKFTRTPSSVFIPNVFSPNNDGINDSFRVFGLADNQITLLNMSIYNRWGQRVFQIGNLTISNPRASWDGLTNGVRAPEGVYVYTIEISHADDQIQLFYGELTLLR